MLQNLKTSPFPLRISDFAQSWLERREMRFYVIVYLDIFLFSLKREKSGKVDKNAL